MNNQSNRRIPALRAVSLLVVVLTLAGCSVNPLYKMTGDVMSGYAKEENTPYVLAMTDIRMACGLGESVDPLLYSFSRVTQAPNKTGSMLLGLSAVCMERRAVAEQLRYLRAEHHDNLDEMRDARESMQRKFGITAERQLSAYRRMLNGFNYDPKPDAACPTFYTDQDEITFLLGLAAGAQALLNDGKSRGRASVPRDIAAQVERSADCVANEKWAGFPDALRASVWVLLPDLQPANVSDPWTVLADSRELGVERGMRIPAVLEMMTAENVGKREIVEESLAYLAKTRDRFEVNPRYSLLDRVGMRVAWEVSDRLWTKEHGYRTPRDKFGETGTEPSKQDSIDTEGLL